MRKLRYARRTLYQELGLSWKEAERAVRIERTYRARIREQFGDAAADSLYPVECAGRIALAIPDRVLGRDQRATLEADARWSFALIG